MKTIYALFSSAIATVFITLLALILTACTQTPQFENYDESIPVVPTTLVYSVDAPGGFDRNAIAYHQNKPTAPETFFIDGKESTISLSEAFEEAEQNDPFAILEFGSGSFENGNNISVPAAATALPNVATATKTPGPPAATPSAPSSFQKLFEFMKVS